MPESKSQTMRFRWPAVLAWCQPWLIWLYGWRYVRFATVGASGTVVNLLVLYALQEQVLPWFIAETQTRLSVALACAIAVATVNNFAWNSLWTWADRLNTDAAERLRPGWGTVKRLFQYSLSCWLGMLIQYSLTLFLSAYMYYLVANVLSIVVASVSNYLTNDWWTFRRPPNDAGA
jgi:dolichol-phosphate mannosyltransferase